MEVTGASGGRRERQGGWCGSCACECKCVNSNVCMLVQLWNLLELAGITWNLPEFVEIRWDSLEFVGVHWNL